MLRAGIAALAAAAALVSGCGESRERPAALPTGAEPVRLDPKRFTNRVDNPWWPMAPGSRWVYRERESGKDLRVEVTVTRRQKTVAGVRALVVRDVVTEGGELIEDTFDWYAQDRDGNVWYLGEDTEEYENGKVTTTAGSWEAGVDGAQAGVIVPARPRPGLAYRQEYRRGEAEDRGRVLSLDEKAEVPYRYFGRVLMTKDFTPLEPRLLEHKFYARGIGPVLTIGVSGGAGREELVSFRRGRG